MWLRLNWPLSTDSMTRSAIVDNIRSMPFTRVGTTTSSSPSAPTASTRRPVADPAAFVDHLHIGRVLVAGAAEQPAQCVAQHPEAVCIFGQNTVGAGEFGCAGRLSKPGIDPSGIVEDVEPS